MSKFFITCYPLGWVLGGLADTSLETAMSSVIIIRPWLPILPFGFILFLLKVFFDGKGIKPRGLKIEVENSPGTERC